VSSSGVRRWLKRLVAVPLVVVIAVGAYYGIGALVVHRIDDDPAFGRDVPVPEGGLRTIATMAALVEREIDRNGWVANDPPVLPGSLLVAMPAFQIAIRDSVRRLALDLQAAGIGGDGDLDEAVGALAMPGDVWAFDLASSWRPQRTSEAFYRDGVQALRRLNARLAAAGAGLDPSAGAAVLERIDQELEAAALAAISHVEREGGAWRDTDVRPLYFTTKGLLHAHLVLLSALSDDVPGLRAAPAWMSFEGALESASLLHPQPVANGRADGFLRPAHLAAQAAFVLRARDELRRVRAALGDRDA
jgi:hypothetical protein